MYVLNVTVVPLCRHSNELIFPCVYPFVYGIISMQMSSHYSVHMQRERSIETRHQGRKSAEDKVVENRVD
jgi:hypothetical protein